MVARILEEAGYKIAVSSTINFKIGDQEWTNETKYTSLSGMKVQAFISRAVKADCEYLVLETSSHALHQHRVWGVDYDVAVITNVTREHLDYHKTMEEYRKAKKKLFEMVEDSVSQKTLKGNKVEIKKKIVVNLDMEMPREYLDHDVDERFVCTVQNYQAQERLKKYKFPVEVIEAHNVDLGIGHSEFDLDGQHFDIKLPGSFNIENALAAIAVARAEDVSLENCAKGLAKIGSIPGRLEKVINDKGFDVIIDYAVTPDSLERVYHWVTKFKKNENNKIIAVFGACGDRDRGKRPIMGKLVSQYADYIIVTNEDPYYEDPQRIMDQVCVGIKYKEEGKNFWQIMDRRDAIRKALELAKQDDIIVITGKGAEETMAIKGERIPWNDRKVVEEELRNI